ncbi:hypoxanthine phosphoribosyltransferase [Stomatohabitans albus]|uniref:hypoxanthine phosphoribosyltransferase n=1 Tax=Stomatohabitans albus TaxID=3110766 RepID=UPI00300DAFAF
MRSPSHSDIQSVLITGDDLAKRVKELGDEISATYQRRGIEDIVIVSVLKGSFIFMADLIRHISLNAAVDFMAVSSYGAATKSSGVVRILKDLDIELEGKHVLVVEDIVDSGLTLHFLLKNLRNRKPASLELCSLLVKPEAVQVDLNISWTGFECPNEFLVGYGLDFAERYRNLPYVGILKPEVYAQ